MALLACKFWLDLIDMYKLEILKFRLGLIAKHQSTCCNQSARFHETTPLLLANEAWGKLVDMDQKSNQNPAFWLEKFDIALKWINKSGNDQEMTLYFQARSSFILKRALSSPVTVDTISEGREPLVWLKSALKWSRVSSANSEEREKSMLRKSTWKELSKFDKNEERLEPLSLLIFELW